MHVAAVNRVEVFQLANLVDGHPAVLQCRHVVAGTAGVVAAKQSADAVFRKIPLVVHDKIASDGRFPTL